ncbi:hypothetical protein D3C84_940510 [compost metagenome]
MACIEIEFSVRRGEVVHAFELDIPGPQAELEIFEIAQRVKRCGGFQRRMPQQQRLAFEAGIAFAFGVGHVGQVENAGVDICGIHVHRWL